jgi:hypothetical protein
LAAGHFRESFHMHPLLILVIIGILLYPLLKSTTKSYKFFINIYVILTISIFVGFYIYRMQNFYPGMEPMVYREDNLITKVLAVIHDLKN